jgi:hypothetical protein
MAAFNFGAVILALRAVLVARFMAQGSLGVLAGSMR